MQISNNVIRLGEETAFEVQAKAKALEATGIDMIHMELNEPDFDTPDHIQQVAMEAIKKGLTRLTPSKGIPEVREIFADHIMSTRKIPIDRSGIVITPGSKAILFYTLLATLNPGDEVIYPDPGFPLYKSVIEFLGAKAIPLPHRETIENGFRFDHEDIWRLANEKTKAIIVNSPHSPTGCVLTEHDLVVISEVAKEYDCWVISDEVFSMLMFDGKSHKSIIGLPGMRDRSVLIEGFSNNYAMSGWRVGYGVMPEGLASHITRLVNNSVTCAAAFAQVAAKAAYEGPQDCVEKFKAELEEGRELIVAGLNSIPHVTCSLPGAGYHVFANFKEFGWSSRDIETYLLQKANVAALSGTSFGKYGEGYMRFNFSGSTEMIEKAVAKIDTALENLPKLESYRQPIFAD